MNGVHSCDIIILKFVYPWLFYNRERDAIAVENRLKYMALKTRWQDAFKCKSRCRTLISLHYEKETVNNWIDEWTDGRTGKIVGWLNEWNEWGSIGNVFHLNSNLWTSLETLFHVNLFCSIYWRFIWFNKTWSLMASWTFLGNLFCYWRFHSFTERYQYKPTKNIEGDLV